MRPSEQCKVVMFETSNHEEEYVRLSRLLLELCGDLGNASEKFSVPVHAYWATLEGQRPQEVLAQALQGHLVGAPPVVERGDPWLLCVRVRMDMESNISDLAILPLIAYMHRNDVEKERGRLFVVIDLGGLPAGDKAGMAEKIASLLRSVRDPQWATGDETWANPDLIWMWDPYEWQDVHGVMGRQGLTRVPVGTNNPSSFWPALFVNKDTELVFSVSARRQEETLLAGYVMDLVESRLKKQSDYLKARKRGYLVALGRALDEWLQTPITGRSPNLLTLLFLSAALQAPDSSMRAWLTSQGRRTTLSADAYTQEAKDFLDVVRAYARDAARACINLTDNVVKHAKGRCGLFHVQIVGSGEGESDQRKLLEGFMDHDGIVNNTQYAIVTVMDYDPDAENMARTFLTEQRESVSKMPEPQRTRFTELQPCDFFQRNETDESLSDAWKVYRAGRNNYWDHYGCRVFDQAMRCLSYPVGEVTAQAGFSVVSHSSFFEAGMAVCSGEAYASGGARKRHTGDLALPGTKYTLVVPLGYSPRPEDLEVTSHAGGIQQLADVLDWKIEEAPPAVLLTGDVEDANRWLRGVLDGAPVDSIVSVNWHDLSRSGVTGDLFAKAVFAWTLANTQSLTPRAIVVGRCHKDFIDQFRDIAIQFARAQAEQKWTLTEKAFDVILFPDLVIDGRNKPNDYADTGIFRLSQPVATYELTMRWLESVGLFPAKDPPCLATWKDGLPAETWKDFEYHANGGYENQILPYHLLCRWVDERGSANLTYFEQHVYNVVNQSIAEPDELGCKHERVHVRLGSTIHLDNFYEAEFLFSIPAFRQGFAFLAAQQVMTKLAENPRKQLVLVGYATYSEALLIDIQGMLEKHPVTKETAVTHTVCEKINTSRDSREGSEEPETPYGFRPSFTGSTKDSLFVVVVPIGSTLKTTFRMISELARKTGEGYATMSKEIDRSVLCQTLIAIGVREKGNEGNPYWVLHDKTRTLCALDLPSSPIHFMVGTEGLYYYPLAVLEKTQVDGRTQVAGRTACQWCFPEIPTEERPLTETSSESTVPLVATDLPETERVSPDQRSIKDVVRQSYSTLKFLKNHVRYPHFKRDDHEYEYYIEPGILRGKPGILRDENARKALEEARTALQEGLEKWAEEDRNMAADHLDCVNYIVCPLHSRNTDFVDFVNQYAFAGDAQIIAINVDKEQRSNLRTKYSWVRKTLEELEKAGKTYRVHYVNDTLTRGGSLNRIRSLVRSIMPPDATLFDRYFILVDRHSDEAWAEFSRQKPEEVSKTVWRFIHVSVPHLRHHVDSCHWCKKEKNARDLARQSVSDLLVKAFRAREERCHTHGINDPENLGDVHDKYSHLCSSVVLPKETSWIRLFCTHVAQETLKEYFANPDAIKTQIVSLLLDGVPEQMESQRWDFFDAYLQVLSRPSLVDHRCVRDVVFSMLVAMMDFLVRDTPLPPWMESLQVVIQDMEDEHIEHRDTCPGRWSKNNAGGQWCRLWHLLSLLMSRLEDLRSTYLVRPALVIALRTYIYAMGFPSVPGDEPEDLSGEEELLAIQMFHLKSATHGTTDTSLSAWLDRELHASLEWRSDTELIVREEVAETIKQVMRAKWEHLSKPETGIDMDAAFNQAVAPQFLLEYVMENNRFLYEGVRELSDRKRLWEESTDDRRFADDPVTWLTESEYFTNQISSFVGELGSEIKGFDDYRLSNVRDCLAHLVDCTNAWIQDPLCSNVPKTGDGPVNSWTSPDPSSHCGKRYEDLDDEDKKSGATLLLEAAGVRRYLRKVVNPPQDETSNQASSQNAEIRTQGYLKHFERLCALVQTILISGEGTGGRVGLFDQYLPPSQAWKSTMTGDRWWVTDEEWEDVTLALDIPGVQNNLREFPTLSDAQGKAGWGFGVHGGRPRLWWRLGDESSQLKMMADLQVANPRFDKNQRRWAQFDRLRIVLMLRDTVQRGVFGEDNAGLLEQAMEDVYLRYYLSHPQAIRHASFSDPERRYREVTDPQTLQSYVQNQIAQVSVSRAFVQAVQGIWFSDGEIYTMYRLSDLEESLNGPFRNPEDPGKSLNVSVDVADDPSLRLLKGPSEEWRVKIDELAGLVLLCVANEFRHDCLPDKPIDVKIAPVEVETGPHKEDTYRFLRIQYRKPSQTFTQADIAAIRGRLDGGALVHNKELHLSYWTLGRLIDALNYLEKSEGLKQKCYFRTEEGSNEFILDLPVLEQPRTQKEGLCVEGGGRAA